MWSGTCQHKHTRVSSSVCRPGVIDSIYNIYGLLCLIITCFLSLSLSLSLYVYIYIYTCTWTVATNRSPLLSLFSSPSATPPKQHNHPNNPNKPNNTNNIPAKTSRSKAKESSENPNHLIIGGSEKLSLFEQSLESSHTDREDEGSENIPLSSEEGLSSEGFLKPKEPILVGKHLILTGLR